MIDAQVENWGPDGRSFEDQHNSFMLLWNGDPVSRVFRGNLTISNQNPNLRVIADQQGIPQTVVVNENVTGYPTNQVVTVNLNNGAHGTVQANESGTITKGSVVQVVNNGDGTSLQVSRPFLVFLEVFPRLVTRMNQERLSSMNPTEATTLQLVKVETTPLPPKWQVISAKTMVNSSNLEMICLLYVTTKRSAKAVFTLVTTLSITRIDCTLPLQRAFLVQLLMHKREYITPENDAYDAYWFELSNYSGQGTGILDMTKNLVDFEVADFVDYIQVFANSRAIGGGEMSRLNYSDDVLIQNQINLEAADGRIIDADIALESTRLAKNQVLAQASMAMVAQANTLASLVLSLLSQ